MDPKTNSDVRTININQMVSATETEIVYCAVRIGSYKTDYFSFT